MRELIARIMRLLAVRRDLLRRIRDRRWSVSHRSGHVLVTTALLLAFLVGLVAFAVDVGAMAVVRGELQRSADASSLAAAAVLRSDRPLDRACEEASRFGTLNPVAAEPLDIRPSDVIVGLWNYSSRHFTPRADGLGNAVQVTGRTDRGTLFFGRIAGNTSREFQASAIAAETPREIVLVLDVSGAVAPESRDNVRAISQIAQSIVQSVIASDRLIPDDDGGRYRDRLALVTVHQAAALTQPLGGTDADYQQRIAAANSFAAQWEPTNGSPNPSALGDALTLATQQLATQQLGVQELSVQELGASNEGGAARSFAEPLLLIVTDGANVARRSTLQRAESIGANRWPSLVIGVGESVSSRDLALFAASLGPNSQVATVADPRAFDAQVGPTLTDRLKSVRTVLAQ